MSIQRKIALQIAGTHVSNATPILMQGFAEMIEKGIVRALSMCKAGIPSMVEHKHPLMPEALDMDNIVAQGPLENNYTPDSKLGGNNEKTTVKELAELVALEHFDQSQHALVEAVAKMIEKGILKALEHVQAGIQLLTKINRLPNDPAKWDVDQALSMSWCQALGASR